MAGLRKMPILAVALAGALSAVAQPVPAQNADSCTAVDDTALPPEFAGWNKVPTPVAAAASADAKAPALEIGTPAAITLLPDGAVRFATPPEQVRSRPGGHSGIVSVRIPAAGKWRVSAGSPVWIDLAGPGGRAVSTAHGHGPACSSIRKFVDFDLQPGDYVLQLSGNPGADLRLLLSAIR